MACTQHALSAISVRDCVDLCKGRIDLSSLINRESNLDNIAGSVQYNSAPVDRSLQVIRWDIWRVLFRCWSS